MEDYIDIILILLVAFMLLVPLFGRNIINLVGEFTSFISNHQQLIEERNSRTVILEDKMTLGEAYVY